MAKALECPACGARHRLDQLPGTPTFRCTRCGQKLMVPTMVTSGPPAADRFPGPPPRRRPPEPGAHAANDAGRVTATLTPTAPPHARPAAVPIRGPVATGAATTTTAYDPAATVGPAPRAPSAPARSRVSWYWRLLAWVVAVPLGFVVTAWPAYAFKLIRKTDVLDIFVGTGIGRYARIATVTVIWALATAVLVEVFVEGGRALAARRGGERTRSARVPAARAPAPAGAARGTGARPRARR